MTLGARRIVAPAHAPTAFDGKGTARFGGRWTRVGRSAVYAASSSALGLLEMIARARGSLLPSYVVFPLEFDDALVAELRPEELPTGWRAYPPPAGLEVFGDAWLDGGTRPILRVPNAIIPDESTFILNPRHLDFRRIRIGASFPLDVDLRLRL